MRSEPNYTMAALMGLCGLAILYLAFQAARPHDIPLPSKAEVERLREYLEGLE